MSHSDFDHTIARLLAAASGRPDCDVSLPRLRHHLGLPADAEWDDAMSERAEAARDWYVRYGTPWTLRRGLKITAIGDATVDLEGGTRLTSRLLADGLRSASCRALVVVAASAGPDVEREIARLWATGQPDAALFLNAFAVSVVEHARSRAAKQLARLAGRHRLTVLPHYSPGYEGWELSDQGHLHELIVDSGVEPPGPLEVLPSGELKPVKSTLAVFGVTASLETDGVAIGPRDLQGFWDRRISAPPSAATPPSPPPAATPTDTERPRREPPAYAVPERTLERWAALRLTISDVDESRVRARFRFDGTTCNNMGIPLAFDYDVELARDAGDYRVVSCGCAPAAGDSGYQSMCDYVEAPERFATTILEVPSWTGRTLDALLEWTPMTIPSGCLCTQAGRNHKWLLVLHTIHYALNRVRERDLSS